jgi:hypothetical protein
MAHSFAEGARQAGANVDIKRAPDLIPEEIARPAGGHMPKAPLVSVAGFARCALFRTTFPSGGSEVNDLTYKGAREFATVTKQIGKEIVGAEISFTHPMDGDAKRELSYAARGNAPGAVL